MCFLPSTSSCRCTETAWLACLPSQSFLWKSQTGLHCLGIWSDDFVAFSAGAPVWTERSLRDTGRALNAVHRDQLGDDILSVEDHTSQTRYTSEVCEHSSQKERSHGHGNPKLSWVQHLVPITHPHSLCVCVAVWQVPPFWGHLYKPTSDNIPVRI